MFYKDYLYFPNDDNTIPCNTPIGHKISGLTNGVLFVWLFTILVFLFIHAGVVCEDEKEKKKKKRKNRNSWLEEE